MSRGRWWLLVVVLIAAAALSWWILAQQPAEFPYEPINGPARR
jgi:hypothetical protein